MNPAYKCSQQEFYSAAKLGWQNYRDNLPDFTDHKGKYSEAFGEEAVNALLNAKNLPDEQGRDSVSETLGIQLAQAANVCLDDWQVLKSYITEAFPEKEQKTRLEAAGTKYYRKAANKGWTEMHSLLDLAAKFIDNNSTPLSQDGNNMPGTFPANFATHKTAFETKYAAFIGARQESTGGTSTKIAANNQCYNTLMKMLADGQVIYRNNETKKAFFVFDTLLSYMKGPGTTGLRIAATETVTELPVPGFAVTVQPGNMQGTTDENGVLVLPLSEGTYTLTGIKNEYEEFTEEVNVTTGVVSRKNIELKKIA